MLRARMVAMLSSCALFWGCSNLEPADPPRHSFEHAHDFGATALAFSPDGAQLASGGRRGDIALWSVEPPAFLARLSAHTDAVRALAFATPGRLVSSGDDGLLVVWDLAARRPVATVRTRPVSGLVVAGERVVTGHLDGTLRSWRLPTLEALGQASMDQAVISLDHHGDSLAVATGSGRVALLDASLIRRRELQAAEAAAHDLRFSPDGNVLVGGGWFRMTVWDVATGAARALSTEHWGLLASVDVSPDGRRLASLGRQTDSAVRVWDRESLTVERRYRAHDLCGAMIRFSPDGRHLASASDDESVRLYDLSLAPAPRSAFSP